MDRRWIVFLRQTRGFALVILLAVTAGCGFQLRGDYGLSEKASPIVVVGLDPFNNFYGQLRDALELGGGEVTGDATTARTWLEIHSQRTDRLVTAVNEQGKASEYELVRIIQFSLKTEPDGEVLVPRQTVEARRLFRDPEGVGFGKQAVVLDINRQLGEEVATTIARIISLTVR